MERRALLVGINSYPGSPLEFCVNDARSVREVLQNPEYNFHCEILEDEPAVPGRIKTEVENLLRQTTEIALFYFAGHGVANSYGNYLLTPNCIDREDDGFDLGLLSRMIQSESGPNTAVVIILDCCQSGAATIGNGSVRVALTADDLLPFVQITSDRRVIIAACKENQYSYEEKNLRHGIFTHHLINALLGDAVDEHGEVNVMNLYSVITRNFEKNSAQRPVMRSDLAGQIVLGKGLLSSKSKVEIDELDIVERTGEDHLDSLHSYLSGALLHRNEWKESGYRTACKYSAPIIEWFHKKLIDYPKLLGREKFIQMHKELLSKTRVLSNLEPGIKLDQGVVKDPLGHGSFGTVWKLVNQNGQIAMKVFHSQDLAIKDKTDRFRIGFNAMKKLDHLHIVKVHAIDTCPLAFTMQFIDGANLRNWVGSAEKPEDMISLMLIVADTLCHAHSRGVVHRDVKPENIIITLDIQNNKWKPFLTDFDLAWFSTASLHTQDAIGSVYYAAPEQHAKPGSPSARAVTVDIFSFGQLLYFAATSSDPTPNDMADNTRSLSTRINKWGTSKPVELFVNLYKDCTNRDPAARPKAMTDVSARLYEVLAAFRQKQDRPVLSKEEFIHEIHFSIAGMSNALDNRITSAAGQTEVTLAANENGELHITFQVRRTPLVDSISDFKRAREVLNSRVEALVSKAPNVKWRSGKNNPYEVFVIFSKLSFNFTGVTLARDWINKILAVLERG